MKLQIKKIREDAILPRYATEGAAGMDLCAAVDADLPPMGHALVPTGIALAVPMGYGAFLFARSGLAIKHGVNLRNGVGVVDSDYFNALNEGHIFIKIYNAGDRSLDIRAGEAFAQGVFLPFGLTEDDRAVGQRLGGFGSTGGAQ